MPRRGMIRIALICSSAAMALITACSLIVNPDTKVFEENAPVSDGKAGSGDEPRSCQTGTTSDCACTDGSSGTQICLADGTYGPCTCDTGGQSGSAGQGEGGGMSNDGQNGSPGDAVLYGRCNPDGSCDGGLICSGTSGQGSYCTKTCDRPSDCPAAEFGDTNPVCDQMTQRCRLDCSQTTCPYPMTCLNVATAEGLISTCVWM